MALFWRCGKRSNTRVYGRIREKVKKTSYFCRYNYSVKLRNIEDGAEIIYHQQTKDSPWIKKSSEAEEWLSEQEEKRLEAENIERRSTKWVFEGFYKVELKVVLDRQPLLGTGPLPDWLRNLDQDSLCLWRCIAVHRGALPHRSTKEARSLAKSFYKLKAVPQDFPKTALDELDKVERHLNQGQVVSDWLGIRVYEPERGKEGEVVWYHRRSPPTNLKNILTIGVYEGHAFIIKDITRLAKIYECGDCKARFTRSNSLQRHTKTCSQGKTVKIHSLASLESLRWLEREAKRRKIHIHHAVCGHGLRVHLWMGTTMKRRLFQYHGCHWHGCRKCFPSDRDKIIDRGDQTRKARFKATMKRTALLLKAGHRVIEAWACEVGRIDDVDMPKVETKSYPHVILYDFEAYGDNTQRKEPTPALTIENVHVPISVSVGDTLEREPTHICERDPTELVRKFMEELERRGKNIRSQVRLEFAPEDVHLLPKAQREKLTTRFLSSGSTQAVTT